MSKAFTGFAMDAQAHQKASKKAKLLLQALPWMRKRIKKASKKA
jgi:hypothetical protein